MSTYAEQLANAQPVVVITPTPLILERAGSKFRGLYLGLQSFDKRNPQTGEIKRLPVAHFYDGEKVVFNMGAQLTRVVSTLKPGTSVEITLAELKPNAMGGKTKLYSIAPLGLPVVNLSEMFGGFLKIEAPAPEHLIQVPASQPAATDPAEQSASIDALYGEA